MSLDKTPIEQKLHDKWIGYIKSFHIPKIKIAEYRRDLKRAGFAVMMVVSFWINAQSGIVAAGESKNNISYTIGETFSIMQTISEEQKEVSLRVPKFELPVEQPKTQPKPAVEKKENWFIKLIKKLFKIK